MANFHVESIMSYVSYFEVPCNESHLVRVYPACRNSMYISKPTLCKKLKSHFNQNRRIQIMCKAVNVDRLFLKRERNRVRYFLSMNVISTIGYFVILANRCLNFGKL